jgi:hypothetical protein
MNLKKVKTTHQLAGVSRTRVRAGDIIAIRQAAAFASPYLSQGRVWLADTVSEFSEIIFISSRHTTLNPRGEVILSAVELGDGHTRFWFPDSKVCQAYYL